MSCSEQINSKFKYAIESNTCPFCGSVIMEEELKNLLTELRVVFDKLQNYPEELKDFLQNNFNLINASDVKQVLSNKVITDNFSSPEDSGSKNSTEPLLNQEKMNMLMRRADTFKINGKASHLKDLVSQIKSGKNVTEDSDDLSDVEIEALDRNELSEMQSFISSQTSSGGLDEFINTTSSSGEDSKFDDEVPEHVLNFANKKTRSSDHNSKDLARLQNMVNKARSSGGIINRSG
jgi:Zn-finger nucleic acid-binding protein